MRADDTKRSQFCRQRRVICDGRVSRRMQRKTDERGSAGRPSESDGRAFSFAPFERYHHDTESCLLIFNLTDMSETGGFPYESDLHVPRTDNVHSPAPAVEGTRIRIQIAFIKAIYAPQSTFVILFRLRFGFPSFESRRAFPRATS